MNTEKFNKLPDSIRTSFRGILTDIFMSTEDGAEAGRYFKTLFSRVLKCYFEMFYDEYTGLNLYIFQAFIVKMACSEISITKLDTNDDFYDNLNAHIHRMADEHGVWDDYIEYE